MSDHFAYSCPYCQIGYCQPGQATYVRMHNGMLVSMPDMPVWTCDICGYQEFDQEAVSNLDTLLGVNDSAPDTQRPRASENFDNTTVRRAKT